MRMDNKVVIGNNTDGISIILSNKSIKYSDICKSFKSIKPILKDYNRINVFIYKDSTVDCVNIIGDLFKAMNRFECDKKEDIRVYFLDYRTMYLPFDTLDNLIKCEPVGIYNLGNIIKREDKDFISFFEYIKYNGDVVGYKVLKEYASMYLAKEVFYKINTVKER